MDLSQRAGLIEHFEALDGDLHPGPALPAFRAALQEHPGVIEPVVITTEETFQDAEFQQALVGSELVPLYVATVGRDGAFQLWGRGLRGAKRIRQAVLDLDRIAGSPSGPRASLVDARKRGDLPAIFSADPFPLLLPHSFDPLQAWRIGDRQVLALTGDRRLMLWEGRDRGARQVSDRVPGGPLRWASQEPVAGRHRAVVGSVRDQGPSLLNIDVPRLRCTVQPLGPKPMSQAVCSHNGAVFWIADKEVLAISPSSGELLARLRLPEPMVWKRDRFFVDEASGRWHALAFDGTAARLEPVFPPDARGQEAKVLSLFDCVGTDGPVAVTRSGQLLVVSTGTARERTHGLRVPGEAIEVTRDGLRVLLQCSSTRTQRPGRCAVDIEKLAADNKYAHSAAGRELLRLVRPRNLRCHFTHIHVRRDGLALTARRGRLLAIHWDAVQGGIRLEEAQGGDVLLEKSRPFHPAENRPEGVGFKLKVAVWGDGSRAFLDGRGLLHLMSSDTAVPEVSLVLRDGELAGWTADGRWFGAAYFRAGPASDPQEVYRSTIEAFVARLR